ncbi:UNVERIFIED_CONTAM: Cyclin-T1-4 [Sesamum angustifolium]|uniref:Cyclin-T1-4 n=1 Tax=Sesamum angustifolium TaxID=2727405 RepID=A0AAW2NYL5_9LAMI
MLRIGGLKLRYNVEEQLCLLYDHTSDEGASFTGMVDHSMSKPSNCYNAYSNAYLVSNSSTVVRCEDVSAYDLTNSKRDRSTFEDDEVVLMSRDEIERCSPSRKDGIDPLQEAHLRYTYCVFLQNLGIRLNLPQTTIGTAMLIATAVLFLASKSEETPRALNDVLRASCEFSTSRTSHFCHICYPLVYRGLACSPYDINSWR